MADNIAITAGSGTTIAADDIGGVKHQRVKLSVGADGEATDLDFGQAAMAASVPVVPASDIDTVITVTPVLDTNAYAGGDLLFDSTEVASAARANGSVVTLVSVTIVDKADQKVAFTLLFANAATDFGALNGAPDPDDSEAATVIGWVAVGTGDYVDLGGAAVACVRDVNLVLKAGAATTSLYIAAVNGSGTPTYGASDLVLYLGFRRG